MERTRIFILIALNIHLALSSQPLYPQRIELAEDEENDYIQYNALGMSYKFHDTPKSWDEAKTICNTEGGHLAMPMNEAETKSLIKMFRGYPREEITGSIYPDYILLGFRNYGEGFKTIFGELLISCLHRWAVGQPNGIDYDENCGSMNREGKLFDYPCLSPAAFICQKHISSRQPSICPLEGSGSTVILPMPYRKLTKEYKFSNVHMPWNKATDHCHNQGGELARPMNEIELHTISSMFMSKPMPMTADLSMTDFMHLGFNSICKNVETKPREIKCTDCAFEQLNDNDTCTAMARDGRCVRVPCKNTYIFICQFAK